MKKLKLDVDALRVESFGSSVARVPEIGTVMGNDATSLCSGQPSCQYTVCQNTCYCPYSTVCGSAACPTVDPARCP
ncbi:MAG TPA: hypothetical protein VE871_11065 [Longimicrobium sp.]|jgi:hypothetical protein|nr:hypothetical protein [Longimicrobium sp.]